jgi:hypothetical protein
MSCRKLWFVFSQPLFIFIYALSPLYLLNLSDSYAPYFRIRTSYSSFSSALSLSIQLHTRIHLYLGLLWLARLSNRNSEEKKTHTRVNFRFSLCNTTPHTFSLSLARARARVRVFFSCVHNVWLNVFFCCCFALFTS